MSTATRRRSYVPLEVPEASWTEFFTSLDWKQGEHVTLVGHTGSGKTTLARAILPMRRYIIVLGAKPRDEVLEEMARDGYRTVRHWNERPVRQRVGEPQRILLWPDVTRADKLKAQKVEFMRAFVGVYEEGNWCLYADELAYLSDHLRLDPLMKLLWEQGRSSGISFMGGTQRPAWIPLAAYSQATHLFLFRDNDARNLQRFAEIGGDVDRQAIREVVMELPRHSFLYINTRNGTMLKSRVEGVD